MKKLMIAATVLLFTAAFKPVGEMKELELGSSAPLATAKMKAIAGNELSLNDAKSANGLLVVFTCNTCPFVLAWENRYNPLAEFCKKNKVGMIAINSNEAKRAAEDSFEAMKTHAKDKGYVFAYVQDDKSALADAFGATRTPHIYLFNKDMILVYKGAIDDNLEDAAKVKKPYLMNAIGNMVAGKVIDPNATKSVGCSIKRTS